MKIGYQGVNGAFSQMAVREFFSGKDYEDIGYSDFVSMFSDVESGKLDYALFPVENTTTGIIARTYDYFQFYKVHAIGEVNVPIIQNLIGIKGCNFSDIREVYSHPEAISQCQGLFRDHPQMKPVVYEDTAMAVRYVKECNDPSKAAIASSLAADIYDMKIIRENVEDNDANMTRFLCVSNKEEYPEDSNKISIMIVLKHVPGALYNALGIFASKNVNVLRLESRPIRGKVFEYCFYLDFEGNLNDPDVNEVLRRLRYDCLDLKVFGAYKAAPSDR